MSQQVFISYKREDEVRVARLVRALEAHRIEVWWDRGLPGGERWRENIQDALHQAACVIVAWTHESTGPAGDFVRDEASQAKARGALVPVLLDRVAPPLGFGEIQSIDLSRWRGGQNDPFLLDLVAACKAKLEGGAAPQAKGPRARLMGRLALSGVFSAFTALLIAFATNVVGLQDRTCVLGGSVVSDACGSLGIGGRPTREERLAWETLELGSCAALRDFAARYPSGAHSREAISLLSARRTTVEQSWVPAQQVLALYVGRDAAYAPTEEAARADALRRGRLIAQRRCQDFSASGLHRFVEASTEAQEWICDRSAAGAVCGYDGRAICTLEERHDIEREACGTP